MEQKRFPYDDELKPDGEHNCNIWQREFPTNNSGADGHDGTALVNKYELNGDGLYNVSETSGSSVQIDSARTIIRRTRSTARIQWPLTGDERIM